MPKQSDKLIALLSWASRWLASKKGNVIVALSNSWPNWVKFVL